MSDESLSAIYQLTQRVNDLEILVAVLRREIAELRADIEPLAYKRLSTADALALYDALVQVHPKLSLAVFAEDYGFSYEALRKYRMRHK